MSYASNRMPLSIEWAHCDPAGIVWNPRFFEFFDTGAWTLFEGVLGVSRGELARRYGILGIAVVEAGANFMLPLKFGDRAELETTATEFGRSSFALRHRVYKDGKLALEGEERRVWAATHPGNPMKLRALPIPTEVIEAFRARAS